MILKGHKISSIPKSLALQEADNRERKENWLEANENNKVGWTILISCQILGRQAWVTDPSLSGLQWRGRREEKPSERSRVPCSESWIELRLEDIVVNIIAFATRDSLDFLPLSLSLSLLSSFSPGRVEWGMGKVPASTVVVKVKLAPRFGTSIFYWVVY